MKVILTCEHAVSNIPEPYRRLFENDPGILRTHEAYDAGAFDLFKELEDLADFSKAQLVGRLLVETNRSAHHRKLFSRFSTGLDKEEKENILKSYYYPYRQIIQDEITKYVRSGVKVLHLSIHSFTPVLNGVKRDCDIGLLYDPGKIEEKQFCRDFKTQIKLQKPEIRVRFNYPYLGKADGFTTSLRKLFPRDYLGIEIEVNQAWVQNEMMSPEIKSIVFSGLSELLKKEKPQS
ncbi:N-formylglutamate amidohydrolase [Gramella jeungdoensis]|uniref:N-formylglutamate amidohydrolase n=1 Tax=Gramella jeungdoensis TaxID=708091 RepID=A0ABT0Z4M0_9FLAO|nr:N-formylglutamate amidohydrolase [Gramella jeungdoensis]MCM8570165.1 N-formylglutamate amidohydrolase [Gramella jeungdoensis]